MSVWHSSGARRAFTALFASLAVLSLVLGCQMKQEVHIDRTGRGNLTFSVELEDYLATVIRQLQEITVEEPLADPDSPVDAEAIKREFAQRPGLDLTHFSSENSQKWEGKIEFSRIDDAFVSENFSATALKIFSFHQGDRESRLKVTISLDTVRAFLEENPSFNNPLMESFGPLSNEGLTDEDYLEMMEYALGAESRRGIKHSAFTLVIKTEGEIVEQIGGELLGPSTLRFSIPLLAILVLDEPLIYSLRFK